MNSMFTPQFSLLHKIPTMLVIQSVEGTKTRGGGGGSVDRTSVFANDQSDVLFPITYSQFSDPIVDDIVAN